MNRTQALSLVISGCGLAALGLTQDNRPPVAVFGTEVQLVTVPVFVTDKAGKAVAGLGAEAFEVLEDGHKVSITAFASVDAGGPGVASPPSPTAAPPSAMQAASRRQFLLLFDLTFSNPAGVHRSQEAARRFVREALFPNDLVAAATFNTGGLTFLVGFTGDRPQVERAIETLGAPEFLRTPDPLALLFDFTDPFTNGLASQGGMGLAGLDDFARSQYLMRQRSDDKVYQQRVQGFLGGLEQLGRSLDAIQGRKQVILLSAGFDPTVISGVQGDRQIENGRSIVEGRLWEVDSDAHFGSAQSTSTLSGLFRALAASDTVIHGVDVTGLSGGGDVQKQGPSGAVRGRESLALLAENSGGQFLKDTNDLGPALHELADSSRYYYVLGFEPADARKASFRSIKVKVRGDGLHVSHRAGYIPHDPAEKSPARDRLRAAEVIAKGLSGGALGIRAVAIPYRNAKGKVSVPVVIELDGPSLADQSGKILALEIYGYAVDANGRIVDAVVLTPTLDLTKIEPVLRQKGLQVLTSFRAEVGRYDLRFLVRNQALGRLGAFRLSVDVPAFGADATLSPPLFMDDPRTRLVVSAPSRGNPEMEIPFRLAETAFTIEGRPVLRNGATSQVCVLSHGAGVGTAAGDYEVTAALVGEGAAAIEIPTAKPRVVADADGFERYVLDIKSPAVSKGEYALRVSFKSAASGRVATTEQAVRVE